MDAVLIARELAALDVEIGVLQARKNNMLSRRCDLPVPDLTARSLLIDDRLCELEPLVIEAAQLQKEAETLKVMIAARAELAADMSRVDNKIETLTRRRQIILDLLDQANVILEPITTTE